jgi:quinoprotein glucose dehydrogenase
MIVDGVMYGPTAGDQIVAVNAATGDEIWRFQPFPGDRPRARGRPAFRGLTYHAADNISPRILFADGDCLWAVDAKFGKPIESFGQGGKITITDCVIAPAVYKNVLVYAGWNGDVFGVDLSTGQPLWSFHTVPRDDEEFADTWDKPEDGANCWGGMALDASRGICYVTLGSPKPNFMGASHRGDNLYGNCVLAIDVTTGKRIWHFQEVRHDIWDMEIAAPPVLVTVNATRGGKAIPVDAVAAVSKMGNTLLLDRVSGKPLFPFRRRRAPTSKIPGERTAAYQPDVELPEPLARTEFSLAEVTNISPAARTSVLTKLQETSATFSWFHPPELGKPNVHFGLHGGAEWTGSCFDPRSGLLYVSTNEIPWAIIVRARPTSVDETALPSTSGRLVYEKNCMACHGPNREGKLVNPSIIALSARMKESEVTTLLKTGRGSMPPATALTADDTKNLLAYLFDRDRPASLSASVPERPAYRFEGYPRLLDKDNYPGCKPPWGLLNAVDLSTGKIAWRVPLGEHQELTAKGILHTGTENFGGPTVTAGGLVFCAGTRDLKIRAFDAKTGEELWSAKLPFGGFAPPSVYEVNGKEYLVIAATGGGKLSVQPLPGKQPESGDAYIAFTLP